MNTNTGGAYTTSNAYATIGAGNYAVSSVLVPIQVDMIIFLIKNQ